MQLIKVLKSLKDKYIKDLKGYSENEIVEMIVTSEIFDTSNLPTDKQDFNTELKGNTYIMQSPMLNDLSLPFKNVLVRTGIRQTNIVGTLFDLENYVQISEVSPYVYVGSITCTAEGKGSSGVEVDLFKIENGELLFKNNNNESSLEVYNVLSIIHRALNTINNLPKHQTYSYTPKDSKPEYHRRKGESTIKIVNRPIYYILNKKDDSNKIRVDHNKGYLKCEYSFLVRGHWRTLHNPKSFGVNRNNERIVQGYTWIKEYMKGEGELIKRVRLVK